MTDTQPQIYQAILDVMEEVRGVGKHDVNAHQRFNFRGIDAVVNALGPAFRKHGVISVPNLQSVKYDDVATSNGKPATRVSVVVDYIFYAPDGSSVVSTVAAEAWDAGDKGTPKAMSVAYRIALLQVFSLPTDEPDPDSQSYERGRVEMAQPAQMQKIGGLLKDAGLLGDAVQAPRQAMFKEATGRETAGGDLTKEEADKVIRNLDAKKMVEEQLGGKDITEEQDQTAPAEDPA